jgi:rhodanese-related sulfurtransferase
VEYLGDFIEHHWQLCVAFVVIFVIIFIYEYITSQKQGKSLSVEQAVDQINNHDAVVIDLRSAELYKKGHIINAIRASEADFKLPKMQRYKEQPVILVCARGIESNLLAAKLYKQGFMQVMLLTGGISAWQAARLSLVKK